MAAGLHGSAGTTPRVQAGVASANPCPGLAGHATTFPAVAAGPVLHLAEFQCHRSLLARGEAHHLPAWPNSTRRPRMRWRAGAAPSSRCWRPPASRVGTGGFGGRATRPAHRCHSARPGHPTDPCSPRIAYRPDGIAWRPPPQVSGAGG
jgi:hypothetical protein